MRRVVDALLFGAAVIGLGSCGLSTTSPGGGGGGTVSAINVGPPAATLAPGETLQLTAIALDAIGNVLPGHAVTWTSDNTAIATVSSTGLVTGVALGGPVTVRATSGTVVGTSRITAAHLVFASVSVGPGHICGLTTSGAAYCWGDNTAGQMGIGMADTNTYPTPVAAVGPGGGASLIFASLSANAGGFTCGRTVAGAAYCWGDNSYGQLGIGTPDLVPHPTPTQISLPGSLTFATIDIGGGFACAVASSGAAYCWGLNSYGQLGTGDTLWLAAPTAVGGTLTFSAVLPGNVYSCGIATGGAAWCWGRGKAGVLGNGVADTLAHPSPQAVSGGLSFTALSSGGLTACGLVGTAAYCWGRNAAGEIGNGTTVRATTPAAVSGGLTFSTVAAGAFISCGVASTGAAYCWGDNSVGEMGIGAADLNAHTVPEAVSGGRTYRTISTGRGGETCAVTTGGVLYCWGGNMRGELGDGTTAERDAPVKVLGQP